MQTANISGCVLDFYAAIGSLTAWQVSAGRELRARCSDVASDLVRVAPDTSHRAIERMVQGRFPDEHMGASLLAQGLDRIADALVLAS